MKPSRIPFLLVAALLAVPASAAVLRYAEDQAPGIVNPLFTTSMPEARINELIFEGLYTDNSELQSIPDLAESSELSPDRMSMTLRLRQDAKWHDGQPFTSEDVVFTINAMKDRTTISTEKGRVSWIKAANAVDDYTVILFFEQAETRPEDKLLFKILPAHSFTSTSVKRTDSFRTAPIGTGPYKLVKYNDDNSISLETWPEYRGTAPIPEVSMREVSDKNYQAKLLLYESIEALVRVLPRDLAVLQQNRKVELYPYQTNSWWYLGFNLARDPWDDIDIRKALNCLVDIPGLLAPIGTGDVLTGPYVKSSPFYNHDVQPYVRDVSLATRYLEQAGCSKAADQWSCNGKPLQMSVTAHQSLESSQEVVINLQSQLQAEGIGVQVTFLDDASWKAKIWRERNYDVILSQWTFDRNEDIYDQFYSTGARNFMGYKNGEVDRLLARARITTDPQEKKDALRETHRLIHDDASMVFLWTLDSYAALSTRVRNVLIHPFYFFTYIHDWTMD